MKNLRWVILIVALIGIITYFFRDWRDQKTEATSKVNPQSRQTSSLRSNAEVHKKFMTPEINSFSNTEHNPTSLELAINIREISPELKGSLLNLYSQSPKIFNNEEAPAIILATILLEKNQSDQYKMIANQWKDHSSWPEAWFVLAADSLIAQNDIEGAKNLLKSKTFEGAKDTARLGRLALLESDSEEKSLDYLTKAEEKDPHNPLIPILRSRVLEKMNRISDATRELSKSMKTSGPKQSQQLEALSDLFRRYGYQPFSISVLDSAEDGISSDAIARLIFWKHVISDSLKKEQPQMKTPYLEYLASLPSDKFWNEKSFERIPETDLLLSTHQEIFWLRLFELIKQNDYQQALSLLQNNTFKSSSWDPQLEQALEIALNLQLNGHLNSSPFPKPSRLSIEYGTSPWVKYEDNAFINAILQASNEGAELNKTDQMLLRSEDNISALLLAKGWQKAAILLLKNQGEGNDYPAWYTLAMTKALAQEKGVAEALAFAGKQKTNPELQLQIAELYLLNGKPEEGLKLMENLRVENNESGVRAAWISAQYYWKNGELEIARQIITANKNLAETPMGREALAILSQKINKE